MKIQYIAPNGASFECSNQSQPVPDVLLTEADGLYGFDNSVFTSEQSGQDGGTFVGGKLGARRIGLTVKLMRDVVKTRNRLLGAARTKEVGILRLTRGQLVRDIPCVPEKMQTNVQDGSIMSLYFLCPSPYWREQKESRVNIATWKALFQYPLNIERGVGFMFGQRTEERVINVENGGSATTGMRIVFSARSEVNKPKISNAMDKTQYILADTVMHAGDILTIQTGEGEKRATMYRENMNAESNAFHLLDIANITFLQLSPGDNYLRYSATEGEEALTVAVMFYPSYLEV